MTSVKKLIISFDFFLACLSDYNFVGKSMFLWVFVTFMIKLKERLFLFSGMGREVEHLIHENTQLLETKLVWTMQSARFCSVNTKRMT